MPQIPIGKDIFNSILKSTQIKAVMKKGVKINVLIFLTPRKNIVKARNTSVDMVKPIKVIDEI